MIRIAIILVFSFAVMFSAHGQTAEELLQSAIANYSEKNLTEAKTYIDNALKAKGGEKNVKVWHVRGFIYKELRRENENTPEASIYRDESVKSYLKAIELGAEGSLREQDEKALAYLAVILNNEASDLIKSYEVENLKEAKSNYEKIKKIAITLNPDTVFDSKDIEFYLAMSTGHRKVYEKDREKHAEHWQISNDYLDKVLEIDPDNFNALYSQGVAYYNRGAYNLERLPYVDIQDLMEIQSESMKSIEIAFPFMMKAHEADSTKIKALRALKIISFNLNQIEESKEFEEKMQQLEEDNPE